MRLLENMVSDLIRNSTGFNARRLVRRIGGGKILLAGGAALAGAFLADKTKSQAPPAADLSGASTPPPLPPVPTSLPPLPPVPPVTGGAEGPEQGSQEQEEISPDLEFAILRSMVAAALADGHLSPEERSKILERVDSSGLPEERVRQIHADLVLPPTPSELAALVQEAGERELLYTFSALLCRQDGHLHDQEESWLLRFATTLEISEDRRLELNREVDSLSSPA